MKAVWVVVFAMLLAGCAGGNGSEEAVADAQDGPDEPKEPALYWTQVAVGNYHSMGVRSDGSLWVWGLKGFPPIRQIPGVDRPTGCDAAERAELVPVRVDEAYDWAYVSVGGWQQTAAIRTDGSLWVWPWLVREEFEHFNPQWRQYSMVYGFCTLYEGPTRVGTGYEWARVVMASSPGNFVTALQTDGSIWGLDTFECAYSGERPPVRFGDGYDWTAISGVSTMASLCGDGGLWLWNRHAPDHPRERLSPAYGWVYVATGTNHIAAICADGGLWVWQRHWEWSSQPPVRVWVGTEYCPETFRELEWETPRAWRHVAFNGQHLLAVCEGGGLWTWHMTAHIAALSPYAVRFDADGPGGGNVWASVTSGLWHTFAFCRDGTLWAWGNNEFGQLGDGTTESRFKHEAFAVRPVG